MLEGIRTAAIIYNPIAGRRRSVRKQQLEEARRVLANSGIECELVPTAAAGQAGTLAAKAANSGADLVIASGGDGTLNEVVNGMTRDPLARQTPLAVLPSGTANVLAKELGIPWDLPRAASLIPLGTAVRISLGRLTPGESEAAPSGSSLSRQTEQGCHPESPRSLRGEACPRRRGSAFVFRNSETSTGPSEDSNHRPLPRDRFFLSLAGAGPDGALVHAVDVSLKLKTGVFAYWVEGAKQLVKYDFPKFRVAADGQEIDATLAVIGRTKHYGGPFRITTGADLFGDEFEVVLFMSKSAVRYLTYLPATWFGRLPQLPDVRIVKTRQLHCEPLEGTVYTQADGEPIGQLPATFEIVPDALTLVVPEVVAKDLAARRAAARGRPRMTRTPLSTPAARRS